MLPIIHNHSNVLGDQHLFFGGIRSPLILLLTLLLLSRYQRQGISLAWDMPILVVWTIFPIFFIFSPFANQKSFAGDNGKLSKFLFNPNLFARSPGPEAMRSFSPFIAIDRRSTPLAQLFLSVTIFTQLWIPNKRYIYKLPGSPKRVSFLFVLPEKPWHEASSWE